MARKTTTKLSFQVTFEMPAGSTIKTCREFIVEGLKRNSTEDFNKDSIKVHLVNKETTYG